MSDMRRLLESINRFAGEPEQKAGDQVRGTDNPKKSGKRHGFADRLVGEDLEYFQQLMVEYKMFEVGNLAQNQEKPDQPNSPVANINPPGAGTTNTNPALQAQADQKGQPGQPQQTSSLQTKDQNADQSQQAAQAAQQKADLTKNISGLKSIDPTLNIQKTVNAIDKDPQHVTAADAEALAHVVNAIEPMLKNNQAAAGLTSNLKRMMSKGQT